MSGRPEVLHEVVYGGMVTGDPRGEPFTRNWTLPMPAVEVGLAVRETVPTTEAPF